MGDEVRNRERRWAIDGEKDKRKGWRIGDGESSANGFKGRKSRNS